MIIMIMDCFKLTDKSLLAFINKRMISWDMRKKIKYNSFLPMFFRIAFKISPQTRSDSH
jgi:hypothetical protein